MSQFICSISVSLSLCLSVVVAVVRVEGSKGRCPGSVVSQSVDDPSTEKTWELQLQAAQSQPPQCSDHLRNIIISLENISLNIFLNICKTIFTNNISFSFDFRYWSYQDDIRILYIISIYVLIICIFFSWFHKNYIQLKVITICKKGS